MIATQKEAPAPRVAATGASRERTQLSKSNDCLQRRNSGELPQFLRDLLGCPPTAGTGLHPWLFKVARQLHAHRDEQAILDLLAAAVDGCGRHVSEREIREAVRDASKCAWTPSGGTGAARVAPAAPKWPARDERRIASILAEGFGQADLWHASPVPCTYDSTDAEFFVDALFSGNPLLCVGRGNSDFKTAQREDLRGTLGGLSLIVPSPMSSVWGTRKSDWRQSMHTLDNTGPRTYLITEFDQGTPDEQSGILWHLRAFAPLVMVLSSGGKSLHGWWACRGADPALVHRFMCYAVSLGADSATWTPSQFVRMPEGWRADKGARQSVFYFNPENAVEGASNP